MTSQPAQPPTVTLRTHTLDAPGVTLTYDVRGDLAAATADRPALLLVGSPDDRRGASAPSRRTSPTGRWSPTTPAGPAAAPAPTAPPSPRPSSTRDDLGRVVEALGAGPVDLFATSGGAVNALALVDRPPRPGAHPRRPRAAARGLPAGPRGRCSRPTVDIGETYQRDGFGPAMAKFTVLVMVRGPAARVVRRRAGARPRGLRAPDRGRRLARRRAAGRRTTATACLYEPDLDSAPGRLDARRGRRRRGLGAAARRPGPPPGSPPPSAPGSPCFPGRPCRLPRR